MTFSRLLLSCAFLSAPIALTFHSHALAQGDEIDPEQSQILEARGDGAFVQQLVAEGDVSTRSFGSREQELLDSLSEDPTTLNVRLVTLDVSALNGAAVGMAIADDVTVTARRTDRSQVREDMFVWTGELDDQPGDAVLVVNEGQVTGTIHAGERVFKISPVGSVHAIQELDLEAFPEEHPPEWEEIEERSSARDLPPGDPLADPDQVRQIDLLVAYTPAAAAAVADIDAHIALAVAENNLANRNSGVNVLVNAAHVYQVNYTEAGHGTDLSRITNPSDGHMDEVHDIRDQHGADAVLLIINSGEYCGLANAVMASETNAFATVHYSCATGYYSFAHELGHLQGAHHNPEVATNSTFSYGHGMIRPARNDRTVMAYNCNGGCTRKPFWSGPTVMEGGAAFGDAAQRNNARVLNRTATVVSNWRSPPRQGGTAYAWANQPNAANYSPSANYAHNSSGGDITIRRNATGNYSVTFEGLGGNGTAGGHVQVSAYGSTNHYCKSSGWTSGGPDFRANVRCFTPAGAAADTFYNIFVRWP